MVEALASQWLEWSACASALTFSLAGTATVTALIEWLIYLHDQLPVEVVDALDVPIFVAIKYSLFSLELARLSKHRPSRVLLNAPLVLRTAMRINQPREPDVEWEQRIFDGQADPPAGGTAEAQANASNDWARAFAACMESRGYSVK